MARKLETFEVTIGMWIEPKAHDGHHGKGIAQIVDVATGANGIIYVVRHKSSGVMSRPSAETLFGYYKPMPSNASVISAESTAYEARISALERELASVLAWKQKMLEAFS